MMCTCCRVDPVWDRSSENNCEACYGQCPVTRSPGSCKRPDLSDEHFEEYRAKILKVHPPLEIIRDYIANAVSNGNLDPEKASRDILFYFEQNGYKIV